jgi:hypothetical protein
MSLLIAGFEALRYRRFLWRAAGISASPDKCLLSALRPVLFNDHHKEIVAAFESGSTSPIL